MGHLKSVRLAETFVKRLKFCKLSDRIVAGRKIMLSSCLGLSLLPGIIAKENIKVSARLFKHILRYLYKVFFASFFCVVARLGTGKETFCLHKISISFFLGFSFHFFMIPQKMLESNLTFFIKSFNSFCTNVSLCFGAF